MSTLCVADMVHAVADMVCGRYRRFPSRLPVNALNVLACLCLVYVPLVANRTVLYRLLFFHV